METQSLIGRYVWFPARRPQSASLSSPSPKTRTNVSALFAARLEMGTGGNAAAVWVPPSLALGGFYWRTYAPRPSRRVSSELADTSARSSLMFVVSVSGTPSRKVR